MAITLTIMALFITVSLLHENRSRHPDRGLAVFLAIMFASIASVVLIVCALSFSGERAVVSKELRSMQDGSEISGNFFLGTGTIDEDPHFTYYVVDGEAARLESVPAKYAKIVEGADRPRLERGCTKFTETWWNWPVPSFFDNNIDCGGAEYTFYVPENSIVNNYRLDAQ